MGAGPQTSPNTTSARWRLVALLDHAWRHSRFYRDLFASHGISASAIPELSVRDLPLVTKELLMEQFDTAVTDPRLGRAALDRWLDQHPNPREHYADEFIVVRTSGGSQTIGTFVYDTRSWQIMSSTAAPRLYSGYETAFGRLRSAFYAVTDRHAGAVTTAVHASPIAHDLLLVSFFDAEHDVVNRLNAFQPHRLTSYASGVTRLAELALSGKLSIAPRQIVVSGDRLTGSMEAKIREAWNAPIHNIYGAAESFFIATKNDREPWMVVDDLNILEVLNGERPAAPGERGRAVLTNLFNYALPIIRYELCDHVVSGPETEEGMQLLDIEGKVHDVLPVIRDDGTAGTVASYALAGLRIDGVESIQFVSHRPDHVEIEYRASNDYDSIIRREFEAFLTSQRARRTTFAVTRVDRIWNSARTAKLQLVRQPNEPMLRPTPVSDRSTPSARPRFTPTGSHTPFDRTDLDGSLVQCVERRVGQSPNSTAVKSGSDALSYDALNRAANRVARLLITVERAEHEPVALMLGHGIQMIVGILGVLKAGKMYVALDPTFPKARNASVLNDAGAQTLITDSTHAEVAIDYASSACRVINIDDAGPHLRDDNLDRACAPETPACLIYTSGSTGEPKGVVQSHRNILHRVMVYTNDYQLSAADRISLAHSYTFSASLRDIFGALLNGAALVLYDVKQQGLNGLAQWMIDERLTVFYSVPTLFRHFLATLTDEAFPDLRLIRLGGEPVSRRDVEGYRSHFSADCLLVNALATTEAGTIRQYVIDKSTPIVGSRIPVGHAVDDKTVVILDDDGNELGVDMVGEIAVKSRYLTTGYWGKPDLSRAAFTPVADEDGMYLHRTGDVGVFLPDQRLMHLGRTDSRVNVRGHRVELAEIEMALLDVEMVKEGVVVAVDGQDGSQFLAAYVVPANEREPSSAAIRQALEATLPSFMIPSTFVMLRALPTLTTGKIDRAALPAPSVGRPQETRFVAARNETEEIVAAIWASVLDIAQVGIHDTFLDLGGDSLRAFRILSQVRITFGVDVPVHVLFDSQTVANLSTYIMKHLEVITPDSG